MMKLIKKIAEGAEAEVWLVNWQGKKAVLKRRKPKRYREKELNELILKRRIRQETRIMVKVARLGLRVPAIYEIFEDQFEFVMEFLDFDPFRKVVEQRDRVEDLGKAVAMLHNNGIVHGDITLENVLYDPAVGPAFIDFGLAFLSARANDLATDLFVFKETLLAEYDSKVWEWFLEAYTKEIANQEIIAELNKIEKRRKYANQ